MEFKPTDTIPDLRPIIELTPTENSNLRVSINERDEKVELGFKNIPHDQTITILLENSESLEIFDALTNIILSGDNAAFYGSVLDVLLNTEQENVDLRRTLKAVLIADTDTLSAINATLGI
jgi:hypothetical protein